MSKRARLTGPVLFFGPARARTIHQVVSCDLRIAGNSRRTAGSRSSRTSSTLLAALPGVRRDLPRAAWSRLTPGELSELVAPRSGVALAGFAVRSRVALRARGHGVHCP